MLVDEIDLHLHPKWQRTIIRYLTDIFTSTQFIVTAHSPLIVQAVIDANVILLQREEDHVVIHNRKDRDVIGYYWLAYEWDNLLFCCPECNRRYKENLFPLVDPSKRAISHFDDIQREEPLFIHPANENPEKFIEYKGIHPRAINGNPRGTTTICETGIDRPFLDERRLALYKVLQQIYTVIHASYLDDGKQRQLQQILDEAARDSAEFASMVRCAVRDGFRF